MIKKFNQQFIKKYPLTIIYYGICVLFNAVLPIVLSLYITYIINHLNTYNFNLSSCFFIIFVLSLYFLSNYYQNFCLDILTSKYQNDLLLVMFKKIVHHHKTILQQNLNNVSYSQKIIVEVKNIASYFIVSWVNFIKGLIIIALTLIILAKLNIQITLILILSMFVYIKFVQKTNQYIFRKQAEIVEQQTYHFAKSEEAVENIEQIKYYGQYNEKKSFLQKLGSGYIKAFLKKTDVIILQDFILRLMRYSFLVVFILISLQYDLKNKGNILLIITVLEYFFDASLSIIRHIQNKQSFKVSLHNISFKEGINESENQINIHEDLTSLIFNQVLSSRQKCQPINAVFHSNNVYVITGENGIGKSTLFDMILGLDTDYKGEIRLNDELISNIDLTSLYAKKLFYVDQGCDLLEYIDDDSSSINKSRGEKQKILFWQTLQQKAISGCVILLDEPTASLDQFEKKKFMEKVIELGKCNIVMMITHDQFVLDYHLKELRLSSNV